MELSWQEPDMVVTGATGTPTVTEIVAEHHSTIFAGYRIYREDIAVSDVLPFDQFNYTISGTGEYTVRTVFTTGNTSVPSNAVTAVLEPVVTLNTPDEDATNVSLRPTFTWTNPACELRHGFRIYLREGDNSFGANDVVMTINNPNADSWTHCAIDSPSEAYHPLAQGTVYHWQVVAFSYEIDALNNPASSFTTMSTITVYPFTLDVTEDKEILVEWTASSIAGVTGFHVLRNEAYDRADADDISGLIAVTSETEYAFTDDDVEDNTKYYYWIKIVYENGYIGFTDATYTDIKVPLPVTLYSPVDNYTVNNLTPTLTWKNNAYCEIEGVRVYLSATNPPALRQTINDDDTEEYEVSTALEPFTVYYWSVVPFNDMFDADNNVTWRFITPKPAVPSDEDIEPMSIAELLADISDFLGEVVRIEGVMLPELPALNDAFYVDVLLTGDGSRSTTTLYLRIPAAFYDEVVLMEEKTVDIQGLFRYDVNKDIHYILVREVADINTHDDGSTLSVTLSSFTTNVMNGNTVSISWITDSETGVRGFHVLRANTGTLADATRITSNLIAATNTSTTREYSFTDSGVNRGGEYVYWLQAIHNDGSSEFFASTPIRVVDTNAVTSLPLYTVLHGVYPNPVRSSANFDVSVKEGETAVLRIFNVRGQMVREFNDIRTGVNNISWDRKCNLGREVGSGVYFYRLTSPSVDSVQRI